MMDSPARTVVADAKKVAAKTEKRILFVGLFFRGLKRVRVSGWC
jgi:hypothetical protein